MWIFTSIYLFSAVSELAFILFPEGGAPPDVAQFFDYASDPNWTFNSYQTEYVSGFETESLYGLKEDFIPIFIWNQFYKLANFINIPLGRYIGLSLNTLFLVWTSFLGLSIISSIESLNNKKTEYFYKILFCSNGIFWMYGSIHIRESMILFFVSLLLKT